MSTTSPRTNYDAVQAIMSVTLDRKRAEAFISSANVLVTKYLTNESLGETLLKEIETYLAAHLMSLTVYRQAQQVKLGDGNEKYAALGKGLHSTTYGQIVVNLDTSGKLVSSDKKKASINVVPQFDDSELL